MHNVCIIITCFRFSLDYKFVQNCGSVTASLNAFLPVLPYPGKFEIYPGKPWKMTFKNKWQPCYYAVVGMFDIFAVTRLRFLCGVINIHNAYHYNMILFSGISFWLFPQMYIQYCTVSCVIVTSSCFEIKG